MVDTPQTYQYRVIKQPNTVEESEQVYGRSASNTEPGYAINSSTNFMCDSLMDCLCWACCLASHNNNPDGCCECNCGECDNCECGGCDNCDCGGCDNCDCGGCDC